MSKIKTVWQYTKVYLNNRESVHKALRLAYTAYRAHRGAGFKIAMKFAKGYFKLGLAWSGFKMPA